jgi:hypothetical protein
MNRQKQKMIPSIPESAPLRRRIDFSAPSAPALSTLHPRALHPSHLLSATFVPRRLRVDWPLPILEPPPEPLP